MNTKLLCNTNRRRNQIRASQDLNGLDYVEFSDTPPRLRLVFLKPPPRSITKANILIEGGRRITGIQVKKISFCQIHHDERDDCMDVFLDRAGDPSSYRICLVEPCTDSAGDRKPRPLTGFDPRYSCLDFRFCLNADPDLDCKQVAACPPPERVEPEINYLAKDYSSFRRVLLDRLAVTAPGWTERHEADLGIALVEVLAYTADRLSYFQDAVATEAYLDTARQRISVRRHARLIDYRIHEGCNARVFVQLKTGAPKIDLKLADFALITRVTDPLIDAKPVLSWQDLEGISTFEGFQPVALAGATITVRQSQNEMRFYTWGDRDCCLPKGSTRATLIDTAAPVAAPAAAQHSSEHPANDRHHLPPCQQPERPASGLFLQAGDILILMEAMGPHTGEPEDADPKRRHAVRLTQVHRGTDALLNQPVVEIEWAPEDALPFALCLSTRTDAAHGCKPLPFVSVALGNIVLADHGLNGSELLPAPVVDTTIRKCSGDLRPGEPASTMERYEPKLKTAPLTWTAPVTPGASATALVIQDPRQGSPSIALGPDAQHLNWKPLPDLLGSNPTDRAFVVETDNEGIAHLRFPTGGTLSQLSAFYRTGNGSSGNIGPNSIAHMVFTSKQSGLDITPWNPLPASGGIDPEAIDAVKRCAPHAFRDQLVRAITADDYAAIAQTVPGIQRAEARLSWSGSWYEAEVAVEPFSAIETQLDPYRRMGHDVRVYAGEAVPFSLEMTVCVSPGYLAGHVKAALLAKLRAVFAPGKLVFGQAIAVSPLIALAKAEAGVADVIVTRLERKFEPSNDALNSGVLTVAAWELPELGSLTLVMKGGR